MNNGRDLTGVCKPSNLHRKYNLSISVNADRKGLLEKSAWRCTKRKPGIQWGVFSHFRSIAMLDPLDR